MAQEGGRVVVMGRREEPLNAVAQACDGLAVVGNTSNLADLERIVAMATERFGGVDVLVANAGVELFGSVETVALEDWRRVFETNLEGAMLAARAVIPAMRARSRRYCACRVGRRAVRCPVLRVLSHHQGRDARSEPVDRL